MKHGIRVAVAVAVIVAGACAVLAQERPRRDVPVELMLAGFHITVARTADSVSLTCEKGCAWKTLAFPLTTKPTPVNDNGTADDKTVNREKEGAFLLRFGTDDTGFNLSCERGCAWRTLGWTYPADGKPVSINEYGMAGALLRK